MKNLNFCIKYNSWHSDEIILTEKEILVLITLMSNNVDTEIDKLFDITNENNLRKHTYIYDKKLSFLICRISEKNFTLQIIYENNILFDELISKLALLPDSIIDFLSKI